jgi:hypothetical protein
MKITNNDVRQIDDHGLGTWKIQLLRKISNILTIMALLTKRLLNENIALTWYSDRDDIFGANQSKRAKTLDILSQFLHVFEVKIKDKNFRYVSDKHTLIHSDFLSISDLSAGAVLDYYQMSQDRSLKYWTKQIVSWMSDKNTKLKKLMIVGEKDGEVIKLYDINKIE